MASNKKTADGGLQWAEVDLRWYFGSGASTASGEMGLRSSLGSQLEAMHAGISANAVVDVDAIEMRVARGVDAAGKMRAVESALSQLSPLYQRALRLAYGERDMRPNVPSVVRLTAEARRAATSKVGRPATETDIVQTILEAHVDAPWMSKAKAASSAIAKAALDAYAAARGNAGPAKRARMQWEV